MTTAEAHKLATTNPTATLTARIGELKEQADQQTRNLISTLKQLDETKTLLQDQGIAMTVDLGDVGNAAAIARRQVEDAKDRPVFEMPRQPA